VAFRPGNGTACRQSKDDDALMQTSSLRKFVIARNNKCSIRMNTISEGSGRWRLKGAISHVVLLAVLALLSGGIFGGSI
jgi:hypothetical protein